MKVVDLLKGIFITISTKLLICFGKNGFERLGTKCFVFFCWVCNRKLCILKGIFPREPKKKVKGNHHTYYHLKDIAFLQHEPLLETFRELRAYDKKIKKAKAKKNEERAKRLEVRRPDYKLDRLIRERFVSFHIFSKIFSALLYDRMST